MPEEGQSIGLFRFASAAAILLFGAYVVSRGSAWAELAAVPAGQSSASAGSTVSSVAGTQWGALSTPLMLCGAALIGANVLYIAMPASIDRLVPVIANIVIGGVLAALTLYFIANTNEILGGKSGRAVSLEYSHATGSLVALVIALAILGVGLLQLRMRDD
ncbi:MAG: hypothetical protein ACRDKI_02040 [Solirubrobacterales bacterium]